MNFLLNPESLRPGKSGAPSGALPSPVQKKSPVGTPVDFLVWKLSRSERASESEADANNANNTLPAAVARSVDLVLKISPNSGEDELKTIENH